MIKKMVKSLSLALLLAFSLGVYAHSVDLSPTCSIDEECDGLCYDGGDMDAPSMREDVVKLTSGCNCPMCWTGCKCGDCWDCTPLYE